MEVFSAISQSSVHTIMEGFQSELIFCVYNFYCNSRFCSNSLCTFIFFFYKQFVNSSTCELAFSNQHYGCRFSVLLWIMFLERQHSLIMQMIGYGTKW